MVSERYLGSAEDVVAAVQAGAGTVMPEPEPGIWGSGTWPRCGA